MPNTTNESNSVSKSSAESSNASNIKPAHLGLGQASCTSSSNDGNSIPYKVMRIEETNYNIGSSRDVCGAVNSNDNSGAVIINSNVVSSRSNMNTPQPLLSSTETGVNFSDNSFYSNDGVNDNDVLHQLISNSSLTEIDDIFDCELQAQWLNGGALSSVFEALPSVFETPALTTFDDRAPTETEITTSKVPENSASSIIESSVLSSSSISLVFNDCVGTDKANIDKTQSALAQSALYVSTIIPVSGLTTVPEYQELTNNAIICGFERLMHTQYSVAFPLQNMNSERLLFSNFNFVLRRDRNVCETTRLYQNRQYKILIELIKNVLSNCVVDKATRTELCTKLIPQQNVDCNALSKYLHYSQQSITSMYLHLDEMLNVDERHKLLSQNADLKNEVYTGLADLHYIHIFIVIFEALQNACALNAEMFIPYTTTKEQVLFYLVQFLVLNLARFSIGNIVYDINNNFITFASAENQSFFIQQCKEILVYNLLLHKNIYMHDKTHNQVQLIPNYNHEINNIKIYCYELIKRFSFITHNLVLMSQSSIFQIDGGTLIGQNAFNYAATRLDVCYMWQLVNDVVLGPNANLYHHFQLYHIMQEHLLHRVSSVFQIFNNLQFNNDVVNPATKHTLFEILSLSNLNQVCNYDSMCKLTLVRGNTNNMSVIHICSLFLQIADFFVDCAYTHTNLAAGVPCALNKFMKIIIAAATIIVCINFIESNVQQLLVPKLEIYQRMIICIIGDSKAAKARYISNMVCKLKLLSQIQQDQLIMMLQNNTLTERKLANFNKTEVL